MVLKDYPIHEGDARALTQTKSFPGDHTPNALLVQTAIAWSRTELWSSIVILRIFGLKNAAIAKINGKKAWFPLTNLKKL
jgi:hypothetical protein